MRTKIFYKQLSRKPSKYEKIEELEKVFPPKLSFIFYEKQKINLKDILRLVEEFYFSVYIFP
ncbi:hypothetical protein, partial [Pseudoalteromonas sp. Q18-MNA-CIBAN-0097]|uniref:hypothetical protein n=1 Tax=Pseudoalteromonas sp. Q18-MNA-CIBAN-0097 TaxID=3140440 RepID=UPI00333357ED